jgi:antitoxin (DNA-binding transcriptional repressor) of toxin-antitoxin stability system
MDVGDRQCNSLSRHLASVGEGRTITVTDHGRRVARIVPADVPAKPGPLIAEGKRRPHPAATWTCLYPWCRVVPGQMARRWATNGHRNGSFPFKPTVLR